MVTSTRFFSRIAIFLITILPLATTGNSAEPLPTPARVELLSKPAHSLARYYETIKNAQYSLDLEYFTVEPCADITRILLNEIFKKIQTARQEGRNFRVRLLVDRYGFDSWYQGFPVPEFTSYLMSKGVEIKIYNQSWWLPTYNKRNHQKFTIADRRTLITGGRNIGDDFFGMASWKNFIDKDVLAQGKVAEQAEATFEEFWTSPSSGDAISENIDPQHKMTSDQIQQKLKERREKVLGCLEPRPEDQELIQELEKIIEEEKRNPVIVECPDVKFIADRPHRQDNAKTLNEDLFKFIDGSKSSLTLENYTFVPDEGIHELFEKLLKNGVKTTVVTNGMADEPETQMLGPLAHDRIFGMRGPHFSAFAFGTQGRPGDDWRNLGPSVPWMVHSKAWVRDGDSVLLGSYNLDPRSRKTNAESGIKIEGCPKFAKIVEDDIKMTASQSTHITSSPQYYDCFQEQFKGIGGWIQKLYLETIKDYL